MAEEDPAPAQAQAPDICVLLNTRSGKRRRAAEAQLHAAFERHPGRFTLRVLKSGQDIERSAQAATSEGFPTIVAAGGDGTISAIAPIVSKAGLRFGVLPFGTFNYFARSIGMPEEIDAAVDCLVTGEERRISRSEVNGAGFLNNASLGAYAAILQRRERIYRRWGRSRIAAYWSVIVTLLRMRTSQPMRITVDGETREVRTPLAFVAANAFQLETFGLPGVEEVRQGKLALFLAPDTTGPALLAFALRLSAGGMEKNRDFTLLTGSEIRIETHRKRRLVARDGEKSHMTSPFDFKIHPGALRLIVPPQGADETG
ncbi:diacylglycerol/lipid kinase family protein [Amaricoccus macauensis]|uniref:diacylglycerol/lipid kinase family protein n=1 Tax=Amaricoccus macauensis TaxID=57001 RepID=UPI003C7DB4A2